MNAWDAADSGDFRGPLDVREAATVVVDAAGVVTGWSPSATELLGHPADEMLGRPLRELLVDSAPARDETWPDGLLGDGTVRSGALELRHRDGRAVRIAMAVCPLAESGHGAAAVLVAAELCALRQWEGTQAMLRGLATQSPVGLSIYNTDLRIVWANAAAWQELGGPLAQFADQGADELFPEGRVISPEHPESLEELMRQVLEGGEPVVDLHYRGRTPADPEHECVWSCSYYRLLDARGEPLGVCEESVDITDRYRAQQRLGLLVRAGARIGNSLEVADTARELAAVCVPQFADSVLVEVVEPVLDGREPGPGGAAGRRLVRIEEPGRAGPGTPRTPVDYPPSSPQARSLASGRAIMDPPVRTAPPGDPAGGARLYVPLRARGSTMGLVTWCRERERDPFDVGELALADELAARTAVCFDNARRYTREHAAALTLQRNLLPRHVPCRTAVEVAHRYLPADSRFGVGGDWFDVIPLSSTRVGLVVGDVVGHGLQAAATMGRLRTTVRALAQLDLAPDELLSRLDDQIQQTDAPGGPDDAAEEAEPAGMTLLYAVYDPVSGRCCLARAGHPLPAVVDPEGKVTFPELPAGPPLGLGGLPFETATVHLPEGSLLALFTDGLVQAHERDPDIGLGRLAAVLADNRRPLEELCDEALAILPAGPPRDDAALLLVRTRALDPERIAECELATRPAAVQDARAFAGERLRHWGLDDLVFTTELVVSELVTNAIRHAVGPVRLRLIRESALICEVSDGGHTSPHLRHAATDEEGGRGLFLVAQLTQRWGTRYTATGKTIWTEQALPEREFRSRHAA